MQEIYDSRLVAGKLRRWSHYLQHYRLPTWEPVSYTHLTLPTNREV